MAMSIRVSSNLPHKRASIPERPSPPGVNELADTIISTNNAFAAAHSWWPRTGCDRF